MVGLIKICVNMDEEKSRKKTGENEGERQGKKKEREKSTNIGLMCGSHKQLKNIE